MFAKPVKQRRSAHLISEEALTETNRTSNFLQNIKDDISVFPQRLQASQMQAFSVKRE